MRTLDVIKSALPNCCRSGAKLLLAVLAAASTLCSAQNFPTKTVTLIVPNPPAAASTFKAAYTRTNCRSCGNRM